MENLEIWKDINGYEGYYQISNLGNVRSMERKVNCMNGYAIKKGGPISKNSSRVYLTVTLVKNNSPKTFLIHRLVAQEFIKNLENKPQVNHINGIKTDNREDNLEWCTRSENSIHSYYILGNVFPYKPIKGKENTSSRSFAQYDLKGRLIKTWGCGMDIHRELGFDVSSIVKVCKGKLKSHKQFIWKYS